MLPAWRCWPSSVLCIAVKARAMKSRCEKPAVCVAREQVCRVAGERCARCYQVALGGGPAQAQAPHAPPGQAEPDLLGFYDAPAPAAPAAAHAAPVAPAPGHSSAPGAPPSGPLAGGAPSSGAPARPPAEPADPFGSPAAFGPPGGSGGAGAAKNGPGAGGAGAYARGEGNPFHVPAAGASSNPFGGGGGGGGAAGGPATGLPPGFPASAQAPTGGASAGVPPVAPTGQRPSAPMGAPRCAQGLGGGV